MPRKKLTDLFVDRLAPPAKGRLEYFDTSFPALALRVTDTGHKSWSLFYRAAGRQRRYTIGNYPAFDPAAARKAASAALHRVEAGGDPAEEKRQRRLGPKPAADDFASVAREYLERQVKKNTAASTYKETARIIETDVIPEWGRRPIGTIVRRDVTALVDKKAAAGAEVQANRILARLRTLFGWAVEKDRIASNPCDGLRPPTKEQSRDRVLSDAEIKLFWQGCDELAWPFGPLFKLLLLTAQRRDEVASMQWDEVDLETGVWNIPKTKAKNGVGHEVQLSPEAIEILKALPRITPAKGHPAFVFSTNAKTAVSGFSRAKERLDAFMAARAGGAVDPWILHDLRRSATTKMAALRIAPHVVDKILNHSSGTISGVAAVYNKHQYGDERRAALAAWGRAVDAIVTGRQAGNIVTLSAARG
jgi:integrase